MSFCYLSNECAVVRNNQGLRGEEICRKASIRFLVFKFGLCLKTHRSLKISVSDIPASIYWKLVVQN